MKRNISCPPTFYRDVDAMSNSTTDGADEVLVDEQEEDVRSAHSESSDDFHSPRGDDSQDEPENGDDNLSTHSSWKTNSFCEPENEDDNISNHPSWKTNSFSEGIDDALAQAQHFTPATMVAMIPVPEHIFACMGIYQGESALLQNEVVQNPGECKMMADHNEAESRKQSMQDHAMDSWTSVMIKNIPNNETRESLLLLLVKFSEEFEIEFDFVYLPMDFERNANLGYAFVNFKTHQGANRFYDVFDRFTDWGCGGSKVTEVRWATELQGLEAHVERYRNSPVMHEDVPDSHKPVIYTGGVCQKLPPPTKKLQAPKKRKSRNICMQ